MSEPHRTYFCMSHYRMSSNKTWFHRGGELIELTGFRCKDQVRWMCNQNLPTLRRLLSFLTTRRLLILVHCLSRTLGALPTSLAASRLRSRKIQISVCPSRWSVALVDFPEALCSYSISARFIKAQFHCAFAGSFHYHTYCSLFLLFCCM